MSTPADAEEMQSLGEVFECLGYELAARNKLIGRILDDGIYKCKPGKTTPKPPDIEPKHALRFQKNSQWQLPSRNQSGSAHPTAHNAKRSCS